jgi:hypothetical protein
MAEIRHCWEPADAKRLERHGMIAVRDALRRDGRWRKAPADIRPGRGQE